MYVCVNYTWREETRAQFVRAPPKPTTSVSPPSSPPYIYVSLSISSQPVGWYRVKGTLLAYVIRRRVSNNQNDETVSRNPLMYTSKENLPIAVH